MNGLTQEQINNIKQGLGKYAAYRRFVARRGKEPIDPITGYGAKANDTSTWGTFEQALACVGKNGIDGIGVELADGLCGIDIDHCINEQGEVNELAQDIISIMSGGYVEISPSGTGLHIIFSGTIPEGSRRKGGVEMYAEGRYFTLTGNGEGIATELSEQAAQVHKKYLAQAPTPKAAASPSIHLSLSDDELLKKISASKNVSTVEALWHGDTSGYNSQSEADIALCNTLAFWTGRDAGQMDRLFRSSGLMREKWDRPQNGSTYGRLTIQKAIDECREVYQPGYRKSTTPDFSKVESDTWEKPIPFDEYPVGPFTENTLPPCLENMAKASATATQTPLSMNYAAVLAAAAITVQGKYKVQITSDYSEPLNIYVAAVAPPAERKSAVLRNTTQALQMHEAQRNELLRPEVIRSSAELDVLMRQQEDAKKRAAKTGDTSELESISKEGAVCRIAGILHCFSCDSPAETPISGETMLRAAELGLRFLQHAQAAYGAMGGDQDASAAKYILKRISGMESITKRNLHQLCRGRFKKIDELEPVITALIDHGYLRESIVQTEGAGRKPSPIYLINPMFSQNAQNVQN